MRRRLVLLTVAAVLVAGCTEAPPPASEEPPPTSRGGTVEPGLRLSVPRAVHRATRLADGSVLITGGCTEAGCGGFDAGRTADIFADGRFEPGPSSGEPRASGTATLLTDGRVLLAGGYPGEGRAPTTSAEIYDPVAQRFEPVGDLLTGRANQTAVLLADGRVLLAGGNGATGRAERSTEIFDPATGAFAAGPGLGRPRAAHVAVIVGDAVLLIGGTGGSRALDTTEIWRDGAWRPGPRLRTPRVKHGAAALPDGRVLVVGGSTDTEGRRMLATTELVDLATGTVRPGPRLTQGEYKLDGAVAGLPDGRVVIPTADGLDVFDPASDTMTRLPGTTYDARSFRTVTPVGGGAVLVVGGYDESITPTDRAVRVRIPARAG